MVRRGRRFARWPTSIPSLTSCSPIPHPTTTWNTCGSNYAAWPQTSALRLKLRKDRPFLMRLLPRWAGIHEDGPMAITQEIFEAFLHCPTKSHLFCRPDVPDATPSQERRPGEESFQQSGSSRLRASVADHEVYTGTPTAETIKRKIYRMILGYTTDPLRVDGKDLDG